MDYFDDVCISFLDKDSISDTFSMEGQKTLGLNLNVNHSENVKMDIKANKSTYA